MDKDLVDQVVEIAQRVVASGAISREWTRKRQPSRPRGQRRCTSLPARRSGTMLRPLSFGSVLTETCWKGNYRPSRVPWSPCTRPMYQDNPDVGCVLHTHSPFATAHAVAHRPIGCWVEALAMFGLPVGVPVAAYGPRGSELAVANILCGNLPGSTGGTAGQPRCAGVPPHP